MPRVKKVTSETKQVASKKLAKPATEKLEANVVTKKKSGLTVDVYDVKGKVVEQMNLPEEIFGQKPNKQLIAQAVRVYLANQRSGNASTKTRGEVKGSSRKIYKQKGTGRARHGSIRAPIFVHGGIVFGPKPRDYSLKLPKKMKKKALFAVLSDKQQKGEIKVLKGLEKIEPKTKNMANVLTTVLDKKMKNVLLVVPAFSGNNVENVIRATRNLDGVSYATSQGISMLDVLKNKQLVLMIDSIRALQETFLKEK